MTDVPSPEDVDFFSCVSGYSFPFNALTADSKSSSETLHRTIHFFFLGLVSFQSYINIYRGVVKIIGAIWMTISNMATTSHI